MDFDKLSAISDEIYLQKMKHSIDNAVATSNLRKQRYEGGESIQSFISP